MPRDPRKLKPSELCQLLNSTPMGTVISARKLYDHRMNGGARIGNVEEKSIDLVRYAGWLAARRHIPAHDGPRGDTGANGRKSDVSPGTGPPAPENATGGTTNGDSGPARMDDKTADQDRISPRAKYDAHKEQARSRQAKQSETGREIGPLPPVKNPKRRADAEAAGLQRWAEVYFKPRFPLKFSPKHIQFWKALQDAVMLGLLKAEGMPRGSGKTTMIEVAAIFAIALGYWKYVVPIGPTLRDARKMLRAIRLELETNDLLAEDYPELCHCIRELEGIAQRARGQLLDGRPTRMELSKDYIILPTIPGAACSGGIIEVRTVTGAIRGMKHSLADGTILRPDGALIDDFQTKASARSPGQCETRLEIIEGDVRGLAGPGKKIACLLTCTVIIKGDGADQILDRAKYPHWNGDRTPFVIKFPTNEKLWDEYADLRREGMIAGDNGRKATAFYKKNRKAMDAGAEVYWDERYDADEISAIQHAMNKKIDNPVAFFAEYQNEPIDPLAELSAGRITIEELEVKVKAMAGGGVERGVVPLACHNLVAFMDVQKKVLYNLVCGFGEHWTGGMVDGGAWPDQGRAYFTNNDAKRSYAKLLPGADFNGQLYHALNEAIEELMSRRWLGEGGAEHSIAKLLIDANWGKSTEVVFQVCRESKYKGIVMPSHGRGIGASQMPLNEYQKKQGDQVGHYWRIPAHAPRGARYLLWDTNYWKTFAADRLRAAAGDRGCVSFFRDNKAAGLQRMIMEHCCSEYPVAVEGRGRKVDEWKLQPGHDNHLWDCFVGCCVAGSMVGVTTVGQMGPPQKRKRIKLSSLQGRQH